MSIPFVVVTQEDAKTVLPAVPLILRLIEPVRDKLMSPVVLTPRVRVCPLVVWRLPSPVKNVAIFPEFPDIEATGVPEFTFRTANLAEAVDCPPMSRSTVELYG